MATEGHHTDAPIYLYPTLQQVIIYVSAYIREEESHRRPVTSTSRRQPFARNLPGLLVLRAYVYWTMITLLLILRRSGSCHPLSTGGAKAHF
jgi:hypothetical protein